MKWTRCVDLSVLLPNEPGGLARLLRSAKESGVHVAGACGFLWGESPLIHVLVGEAESRDLLESAGFDIRAEREVLVIEASDPQAVLGRASSLLAQAGVNMDICYLSNEGSLVLGIDDFHRAATVLDTEAGADL